MFCVCAFARRSLQLSLQSLRSSRSSRLNSTRNSTRAATKKWLVPVSSRALTRQPAKSYGSYGSYGHTAAWQCATSLPSPRQGWDSSTEVGIPTLPSKERDTGNAGIPCRNPALNSPQSLIQRASTQVAPVQHKCHLCYLCSHSCRAKPRNLHSPRVPCYTRLISTCRITCRMNMFLALVAFVVIRVIRGVVCLTYHLFRSGTRSMSEKNRHAPLQIPRQRGGFDT